MLKEFRDFIARGNVMDLAVGLIMGAAFGDIVKSLVNDIIMPPIGLVLNRVDFKNLFVNLSETTLPPHPTLKDAQDAKAVTLNYGSFVNTIISFLIVAFVVFLVVKGVNKLYKKEEKKEAPKTKDCPFCKEAIPVAATKCGHCTSALEAAA